MDQYYPASKIFFKSFHFRLRILMLRNILHALISTSHCIYIFKLSERRINYPQTRIYLKVMKKTTKWIQDKPAVLPTFYHICVFWKCTLQRLPTKRETICKTNCLYNLKYSNIDIVYSNIDIVYYYTPPITIGKSIKPKNALGGIFTLLSHIYNILKIWT